MGALETLILETARRRTVFANEGDAKALGAADAAALARTLQAMQRRGLLYISDRPRRNYWGSTPAGYRTF